MRALSYFFDEAAASVVRGFKTALLATATIAVAFIVLGGFLILTRNLERLFTEWQNAAEFSVYLAEISTPDQRVVIEKTIEASALAAATEAVSKEEAMRRFRANFSALAEATSGLPSNPLPASIEVRLRRGVAPGDVATLAQKVAGLPGVADVRYDRQWIERLMRSLDMVRTGGLTLAALLVGAAALTVASVVRLALVARQEEIHIMQLVGAPITYIRGPFIVEGFIQGGVGAVVAIVVLWIGFIVLRRQAGSLLGGAVDPAALVFLSVSSAAGLVAAGMAVGAAGGFIAARQTREVADESR